MDRDLLLSELLGCGTADLGIIDDCEYDISEVLEMVESFGYVAEKVDLGAIAFAITQIAKGNAQKVLDEKIEEFKDELEELLEESEENENSAKIENLHSIIADLESLNPYEDFELWFNYLDTHISCIENTDIYQSYMENEIETVFGESGIYFYF